MLTRGRGASLPPPALQGNAQHKVHPVIAPARIVPFLAAAIVAATSHVAAAAASAPDAASAATAPRAAAPLPADQAAIKAHVVFLSSDALRGREAGTSDYDVAATYVAAQFLGAGLQPVGDHGSYFQAVPLVAWRPADRGDLVWTARFSPGAPAGSQHGAVAPAGSQHGAVAPAGSQGSAAPAALAFGEDYLPGIDPAHVATTIDAPVVFIGYGIVAPGRDDYDAIDVRGRIVAFVDGAPGRFGSSDERAHFAAHATKMATAAARGAVGAVLILPQSLAARATAWNAPTVGWADADGRSSAAGAPLLATIGSGAAIRLFAQAPVPWPALMKSLRAAMVALPAEILPGRLTIAIRTASEPLASSNVVGMIAGSDPSIGREVVVLSAHLDHLGVGIPVAGDAIYHGAEDNAVGVAALIEEAKLWQSSGRHPRRSILFLADTAEEKGLVGADYFVRHPVVPIGDIVADLNLDMPILTYRFDDMIAFGADRSSLGGNVARALGRFGLGLSPDPDPAQGFFVRSDHYRFVQRGIPAVFLWPGQAGAGRAAYADFFAHHYHQPSDDIALPIDWAQAVRFVAVNDAIARDIADADARPRWNKGDFFGLLYHGIGAR